MRRFWLPDYEKKLITELQKQQNSAQFCDTLLETEGISIPTHSSVLSALSLPMLRRLSSSPAPPAGQKRRLKIHEVKPQTLLKLVGLLYSGELNVEGATEQHDVLAAALSLGLPDLVEGDAFEVQSSQEGCKKNERGRADTEKRDIKIQVTSRSFCVSTGTQTVNEDTDVGKESSLTSTATLLTRCSVSEQKSPSSCLASSSKSNNEESTLEQSSDFLTSSTQSEEIRLRLSPSESSNCSRLQEREVQLCLPETSVEVAKGGQTVEEDEEGTGSDNREYINQEYKEKMPFGKSAAMEKMEEIMETTQISIKVKLRRSRAEEEIWEVVNNLQNPDALSGVAAQIPESHERIHGDLAAVQPSPSAAVCHTSVSEVIRSSPKTGSTTDDSSGPVGAPSGGPLAVPLPAPRPVEDTADEQIDKLLEDIMIGLNILPMEKASNKTQEQDRASCQVQKDNASYCGCEDFENQSSTHKVIHGPGCTGDRSTEPSGANSSFSTSHENSSGSTQRADGSQTSKSPQSSSCLSENDDTNAYEDSNVLALLPLTAENEVNLFSMADLQYLPCLSPLDSNNNASSGKKSPAKSTLPSKTWLMDNPVSLEFPMNNIDQRLKQSPSKQNTSEVVEKKNTNTEPNSLCAESQLDSKTERNFLNKEPPQNQKNGPNRRLNKTWRLSEDTTINLSPCKVSLSSNNVLAKERKQLSSATKMDQEPIIRRSLRSNAKDAVIRTSIRSRKKCQPSALITSTPKQDTCETGRKRRRTRKESMDMEKRSKRQTAGPNSEQTEKAKRKTRKRPREKDFEEVSSKQDIPPDAKKNRDENTANDESILPTEKRPRLVSLKEFQDLIKRQHLKKQRKKNECDKEQSENTDNTDREEDSSADPIQNGAESNSDKVDGAEYSDGQNDHTQLLCPPASSPKTPPEAEDNGNNVSSGQSEFCIGVIAEEVTKISEDLDKRSKASPVQQLSDSVTDSASENEANIVKEDLAPLLPSSPQLNASTDHTSNSAESENGHTEDIEELMSTNKSAGCPKDDEEDVDVLLHSSPDRASTMSEGHKLMEISPDEEEGEESNEVDVTGSETDA